MVYTAEIILEGGQIISELVLTNTEVIDVQITHGDIYTAEVLIINGRDGQSAYLIWLAAGHTGTIYDFIEYLKADIFPILEILLGVVNGNNKTFNTSEPYLSGSILVFINGLKERFVTEIDETTIMLTDAPSNIGFEDIVEAYYIKKI